MAVKIAFTGDVAFSRHYKDKIDADIIDPEIVSFLTDTDYNVLNVEGAMAIPTGTGMFYHTNDPKAVKVFSRLHGNIWNIANNHTMDVGEDGMRQMLSHAKDAGVMTIGGGMNIDQAASPLILPEAGGIGIFSAVYYGKTEPATKDRAGHLLTTDPDRIRANVEKIKKLCRWCVLVLHNGSEFLDVPSQDVRDQYKEYISWGVDAIIAHHPHVPQNYEYIDGKPVFYSLGNFIFDTDYQRRQPHTTEGVLVKLFFTEDELTFDAIGTKIDRTTGYVSKAELPAIFRPFTEEDYEYLNPLASKRFLEHEKVRMLYVDPEKFGKFTDEDWVKHWLEKETKRKVLKICVEERAKYDPDRHDPKYKELEDYLI